MKNTVNTFPSTLNSKMLYSSNHGRTLQNMFPLSV